MHFGYYEFDDYFRNSEEFLKVCEAVFVCPCWEDSEGVKSEIETAESLGIPVYYKIEDLPADRWA
jgi:hypothetical protein